MPVFAHAYVVGDVWDRSANWTEGEAIGAIGGNPSPDFQGNPVWGYWSLGGDEASSTSPTWYAGPREAMVWDGFQHGTGPVRYRWTRPGASEPAISQYMLSNSRTPEYGAWSYQAMSSWTNPVEDGALFDIVGTGSLVWDGSGQLQAPYDIELAIVKHETATNSYVPLFTQTFSRPTEQSAPGQWEVAVPLDIRLEAFAAGDELLISTRNPYGTPAPNDAYVILHDSFRIIFAQEVSAVPNPATSLMFGTGLGWMALWLRRATRAARRPTGARQARTWRR